MEVGFLEKEKPRTRGSAGASGSVGGNLVTYEGSSSRSEVGMQAAEASTAAWINGEELS